MPRALGHSVLPLPCENRRLSIGNFVAIFFLPVPAYRRFIWLSVQASNFLVLLRTSEKNGIPFLLVVQDPKSRAHHLSAPPKSHNVASKQQDVQPFFAHPATTPPLLGTNALRCASVGSHGSNAFHCCAHTSCDTCPTISGAQATNFESLIMFFRACSKRWPSIGATLTQQDCCPQHHQPQHGMIDLLKVYDIHLSELLL